MSSDPPSDRTRPATPDERVLQFQNLRKGARFANRYRILGVLGSGGAGEVYRAEDEVAGTQVALKVLYPGTGGADLGRLRRELRLLRALQHPGILQIYDIGTTDGLLYAVSELLSGETLRDLLQREGRLAPERAEEVLRGIFGALSVAHDAGVIHRDIKPGNVFLAREPGGEDDRVVLLDFGLARTTAGSDLTTAGRFLGTPEYCSPEQARGETGLGPATDLYACGVTLWEMLAGRVPFQGQSDMDTLNAHLRAPLPNPRKEMPAADRHMRNLLLGLLEKQPRHRPAGVTEATALLDRDRSLPAIRMGLSRMLRRRGLRAALLSVVGLVVAVLVLWLLEPVSARPDGKRVLVRTRAGIELPRGPMERKVTAVALEPRGWGPFRGTWLALAPTWEPPAHDSASAASQLMLGHFPSLVSGLEQPWSGIAPLYWRNVYPGFDTPYIPKEIYPLDSLRRAGEARVALRINHSIGYPASIILLMDDRRPVVHHHPGHVQKIVPARPHPDGRLLLVALGFNNWVGPRHVLFALPATTNAHGQSPPYLAAVLRSPRARGWYLFLPAGGSYALNEILVEEAGARVLLPPDWEILFDLETGVPMESRWRGGLSTEEWARRQELLLATLHSAAGLDQAGDRAEAAQILEAYASEGVGSAEQLSIPLYRAALLRMKSSRDGSEWAYEKALENISLALEKEPDPSRYRLLRAELLARLARTEAAAEVIAQWGRQQEQQMHAFEWYLVDWLVGMPTPVERFLEQWPEAEAEVTTWALLIRVVDAYRAGRFDEIPDLLARFPDRDEIYAIHYYWAARAMLDRPRPDAERAVDYLQDALSANSLGWKIPTRPALARARGLLGSSSSSEDDLAQAAKELAELRVAAVEDLHSFVVLRFAEQDMALAATDPR